MRRLIVAAVAALVFSGTAVASDSPYETLGKWGCASPCKVTYSIDPSYPARSAQLVRETYAAISRAPEIDFVETNNGKVKWETCESTRTGLCGFWTRFDRNSRTGNFRSIEVVIDTTSWDQLADLKSYICHEALHTVGFAHAPRYLPSCFNGTSPTFEPGQEDYELITMMYGG
jgi:hypothetical protein